MSYPGQTLEESYPYAEMQLLYSTALADWVYQKSEMKMPDWILHHSYWVTLKIATKSKLVKILVGRQF